MNSKLRIKIGAVELEYEGATDFSIESIKDLFSHLEVLSQSKTIQAHSTPNPMVVSQVPPSGASAVLNLHTNSIASKLAVQGGPDLALAAAAHMQIVQQKNSFSRSELLADMKSATSHYKKTMLSNLSTTIDRLVKSGKINQISSDSFSLSASTLAELENQLA